MPASEPRDGEGSWKGTLLRELYRDEHIVVVNKPSGLLVHRGWGRDKVTAVAVVRDQTGRYVYPAHRLDRGTSGAIVFTFSKELIRAMQQSFEAGLVLKNYLAIVRGIAPVQGLIDHPIAKSKEHERRAAQTAFRRLETHLRYSLMLVRPYSGRLHQVRRHLKFISHPMIGDTKYGKSEHNQIWRESLGLSRLSLHALVLQFPHPLHGERVIACAPLPDDLAKPCAQAGWAEAIRALAPALPWEPERGRLPVFGDDVS